MARRGDAVEGLRVLVLAAALAAWPVAFIAMHTYLDRFARLIEINASLFIACLIGMLAITSLTIGGQIVCAARARPQRRSPPRMRH